MAKTAWTTKFRYRSYAQRRWRLCLAALKIYGAFRKNRIETALSLRDKGMDVSVAVEHLRETADFLEKVNTLAGSL